MDLLTENLITNKRLIINQGGTSSGKTWAILKTLLYLAVAQKRTISVVSESMPHLKRGAIRDFINILADRYDEKKHNKSDHIYQVDESIIEFFSVDSPDRLRGARRDILFINECNNITWDSFNQLEVRTKNRVYLDYNPVSEFWVHKYLLHMENVKFIHSTYKDNPDLDPRIVKSIESRQYIDENWWRVYGLGEVGSLEGLVFPKFIIVDKMPEDYNWKASGLDFGYTNDPTALIDVIKVGDDLYLDEILYETGLTNDDICTLVEDHKKIEMIADSAEPKSIEEIHRKGFFVRPAVKGKDSVNNGIGLLKQFNLKVTKRSINLIKEFRNYSWKQDKNGEYLNKPIDNFNHGIDAVRYVALKKCKTPAKSWVDAL